MAYTLEEIGKVLKGANRVVIFPHDNPDPDAIASAWGMQFLLKEAFNIKGRIVYGGFIGRAENKAMVNFLKIKLSRLANIKLSKKDKFILIDTQPGVGNNSLPKGVIPSIVIDHHPLKRRQKSILVDVREDVGACSTIVTEYLMKNGVEVPKNLATALFYGISSETMGLFVETENLDKECYKFLFPRISQFLLSKVQHPQHEREFFFYLKEALENARIYRNVVLVDMGILDNADLISEFCSFFLSFNKATWALSFGIVGDRLVFSIRTQNRRARAGRIAQRIVKGNGKAGGHGMSAGGWVKLEGKGRSEELTRQLIGRFLKTLGHNCNVKLSLLIGD